MSKARIAVTILLAGGLLAAGGATAASADTTPTPVPVSHRVVAVPWQFDLQQSDIGAIHVNDVEATNPILAHAWTDTQLSPNVDRFSDGTGDSVTLRHDSLFGAVEAVNLRTCTVTFDQPDGRFAIIAGTGTGANLRSLGGRFDLQALFSFPLVRHLDRARHVVQVCPLAFVSRGTIVRSIVLGSPHVLPQPTFADVAVQGRADLVRVRPVIHPFTPVASPTETVPA